MILSNLVLWLFSVTPGPGWSTPSLVTEELNTPRPEVHINMDDLGRFHLIWSGYGDESRIGYKAFLLDGTTVYPDTMISLDSHSSMVSRVVVGDSIFVFWRDYNPVYYCICDMTTGEIAQPATYFFTTYTNYKYIRVSADSLGRIHAIYRDAGDVRYAVWDPTPGLGLVTVRDWKIEGADAGGVLLVDGNRVHVVVQDPVYHDYCYLQYNLDGTTIVPLTDFTVGDLSCSRDPELAVDPSGNLMVVEKTGSQYTLWKLDKDNGSLLVDEKVIVFSEPPEMYVGAFFVLRQIPGVGHYYLTWADNGQDNQIPCLIMDSNGDVLVGWDIAYDYADEDPENLPWIDGVVGPEGNLYLAYEQGELEPIMGYYPTFGWFDYSTLSVETGTAAVGSSGSLSFSVNPVQGSVMLCTPMGSEFVRIYDLTGREVCTASVSEGIAFWDGRSQSGERLPAGVYAVTDDTGLTGRITLLDI